MPFAVCQPRLRGRWLISNEVCGDGVVVNGPALGQHTQFLDRVEDLPIQELVSEFAVERFAVAVLAASSGRDLAL
jgi:hypothetical protein